MEIWEVLYVAYFVLGVVAFFLIRSYSTKRDLSSTFADATTNPVLLIFAIALWPAFLVNDLLAEFPKQRRFQGSDADDKKE